MPLYKSLVFLYLTVSLNFINYYLQIFLLFVRDMPITFTSYNV